MEIVKIEFLKKEQEMVDRKYASVMQTLIYRKYIDSKRYYYIELIRERLTMYNVMDRIEWFKMP